MQLAIDLEAVRRIEHHETFAFQCSPRLHLKLRANRPGNAHFVGINLGVASHRQDVIVARDEPGLYTLVEVHGVLRAQTLVIGIRVLHDFRIGEGVSAQGLHA
jgi:hypothetical protein